jgi:hypothetical protein
MAASKICYSKFQLHPQLTFFLPKGISVPQLLDLLEACYPMLKSTKNIHLQLMANLPSPIATTYTYLYIH